MERLPLLRLALLLVLCCTLSVHAQNHSGFGYQALVRDASGTPLPAQAVSVKVLIKANPADADGYREVHSVVTDANGLIALVMGEGTPEPDSPVASFADLTWPADGSVEYTVFVDIAGGTDFATLGSGVFKAVPFAMHALRSGTAADDQDDDGWQLPYDLNDTDPQITSGWSLLPAGHLTNQNAGNVGIGTTAPQCALHVSNTAGTEVFRVGSSAASAWLSLVENGTRRGLLAYNAAGITLLADGANDMRLQTNGAVRLTVASDGNVGIGTLAPASALHVANTTGSEVLRVGSSASSAWLSLVENGNRRGLLAYNAQGVTLLADGSNYLNFQTNGSIRMSVAPGGRVGIGTQAPSAKFTVTHTNSEQGISIQNSTDGDFWAFYVQPNNNALQLYLNGAVRGAFNATSGAYTNVSDRRYKKDIEPLRGMLGVVQRLQPSRYHFNEQAADDPRKHYGLIAQDLLEVLPELVMHDDRADRYSVSYTELIPVLIGAIQEQQAQIAALQAEAAERDRTLHRITTALEANTRAMATEAQGRR